MKIISMLGMFVCFYTPFGVINTLFFTENQYVFLLKVLAACILGFCICTIFVKEKFRFLIVPAVHFFSLLIALVVFWVQLSFFGATWLNSSYSALVLAAFYIIGVRSFISDFGAPMRNNGIVFGIVMIGAALAITFIYEPLSLMRQIIYVCMYVFTFASLIITNQSNLEDTFVRQHVEKAGVPISIRRSNFLMIGVFFVGLIAMLSMSGIVIQGLRMLGSGAVAVIRWIFYLISMMGSGEEQVQQPPPEQQKPELQPTPNEESLIGYILNILLYVVVGIIAFYGIYRFLPRLIKLLLRKLSAAFIAILAFLEKLFRVNSVRTDSLQEYDDKIEIVVDKSTANSLGLNRNDRRSRKRKSFKNPYKVNDLKQRVRCMYSNVLLMLIKSGVKINSSDTTRDILEKANSVKKADGQTSDTDINLEKLTQIYEFVRYYDQKDGFLPETAIYDAEESYEYIKKEGIH